MQRRLAFLVLRIDVDIRLCQKVGESNFAATESRPNQGRRTGIISVIDIKSLVVVEEVVQTDGLVTLGSHVESIHTQHRPDLQVSIILNKECYEFIVAAEGRQVQGCTV